MNGSRILVGKLGDPCDTKNECYAPFSQCVKGICSCPSGFEPNEKKDACQSSRKSFFDWM